MLGASVLALPVLDLEGRGQKLLQLCKKPSPSSVKQHWMLGREEKWLPYVGGGRGSSVVERGLEQGLSLR